ncbi:MAG: tyrosine--tRNA ligase [Chloroflexi bacterium]|nr:MAG: tyrosine--tRNA ligase [Chloroflexota bacterium]
MHRLLDDGRVVQVHVREDVERKLRAGTHLRLKMGFDPSRPDIHIGHWVGIKKMRQFQELGHTLVVIIGDWTAQIGDPTGRSAQRTMLSAEEVRANAETYLEQFFKIIDVDRAEIQWQSSWFGSFNLTEVIRLTAKYTVAKMLQREDFAQRYEAGSAIAITELLYPLLQAYDSVAVRADIEFGGTDQTFNLLVGRDIMREYGMEPQNILTVPLLVGLDGERKMSKSYDNYVGVAEDPNISFGKLMSVPDQLIEPYLRLVTDVPAAEVDALVAGIGDGTLNPRDVKDRMAWEIVAELHGIQAANEARAEFERVFRARELPSDMPEHTFGQPATITAVLLTTGLASSNNEARRLIEQGGVRLDGQRVLSPDQLVTVTQPTVLQAGRRRFVRLLPGTEWSDQ